MKYRTRLGLAFTVTATVPVLLLGLGIRRELTARVEAQSDEGVDRFTEQVRSTLTLADSGVRERLRGLAAVLRSDNRFRLAVRGGDGPERTWLLDWGGEAMRLSGLDVLQLRDSGGRILSSGHFRNEYGRLDPGPPERLRLSGGAALLTVPGPNGPATVMAGVEEFQVGRERFSLVGGSGLSWLIEAAAAEGGELGLHLVRTRVGCPAGQDPRDGSRSAEACWPENAVADLAIPLLGEASPTDSAWLVVTRNPEPLRALRRGIERWSMVALAGGVGLGLAIAWWLAAMVARPLTALAQKAGRLDLERLDQGFDTEGTDEIGMLEGVLAAMAGRIRSGAQRLREAERRAATGELARQVNHDVKNGIAPIRHVLRHLGQTAEHEPARLPEIYRERRETLESSVEYLDNLARTYARLSTGTDARPTDAGPLLHGVARAASVTGVEVEAQCEAGLPPVRGDAVALRRIVENLVSNAVEAVGPRGGRVWLRASRGPGGPAGIRVEIRDSGPGMTRQELARAFEDSYTTKRDGVGLGLSVVRRLVADLGGTLQVASAPGQGTVFTLEFPAA